LTLPALAYCNNSWIVDSGGPHAGHYRSDAEVRSFLSMLQLIGRRARGVYAVMLFVVMLVALLTATAMKTETSEAVACSDATIGGNYGLQASGAAVNPNGSHSDLVFIGRTTYDGHGQLSGLERASVEGVVEPVEYLNGT